MCMMMLSDSPDFKYEFRPQTLNGCGMPMGYKKDELMTYMSHVKVNIVGFLSECVILILRTSLTKVAFFFWG